MLPDAESANVIGEIVGPRTARGSRRARRATSTPGTSAPAPPTTAAGASRRGKPSRLMKTLGLRPRRTVRAVLFTNEENGLRGGLAYRDQHLAELANHVLMIETDGGVFRPLGFGFSGNDSARATVKAVASLLAGIEASRIGPSGRRRRHRPERAGRQGAVDVARCRRCAVLHDSPHGGGHDRQDRAGRHRPLCGRPRGDGIRRGRPPHPPRAVMSALSRSSPPLTADIRATGSRQDPGA